MSNIKESLVKIMQLDGALGSCVVDSNSGMMLGSDGGSGPINLEIAAAGNTEVVRAKRKTMKALNLGVITVGVVSFTIIVASLFALTRDNLKARLAY